MNPDHQQPQYQANNEPDPAPSYNPQSQENLPQHFPSAQEHHQHHDHHEHHEHHHQEHAPRPEPAPLYPTPTRGVVAEMPTPVKQSAPVQSLSSPQNGQSDKPVAVVSALSVRGVEYTMMSLALWLGAGALLLIILMFINEAASFAAMALPISMLLVCVPVFAFFFLRLKKAELDDPSLRFDPSKRRLTQFTQIFTFAACLFNVIAYVYAVMQKMSGDSIGGNLVKSTMTLVAVLVVAGGLFAYYWHDEHRFRK